MSKVHYVYWNISFLKLFAQSLELSLCLCERMPNESNDTHLLSLVASMLKWELGDSQRGDKVRIAL